MGAVIVGHAHAVHLLVKISLLPHHINIIADFQTEQLYVYQVIPRQARV